MIGLLRAEFSRVGRSAATYALVLASVAMIAVSGFGNSVDQLDMIESGQTTVAAASEYLAGMAFMCVLFSTIYGVLMVTRDVKHRIMPRLLQIEPRIWPIALAKAVVAVVVGAVIGAASVGAAMGTAALTLSTKGYEFVAPENVFEWAGRYILHASIGGVWGVLFGFIFASSTLAIVVHVVYQTMLESSVIHFFPKVGRWLPGGAQASLVADVSLPERFSFGEGLAIYFGWVLLLAAISVLAVRTRRSK